MNYGVKIASELRSSWASRCTSCRGTTPRRMCPRSRSTEEQKNVLAASSLSTPWRGWGVSLRVRSFWASLSLLTIVLYWIYFVQVSSLLLFNWWAPTICKNFQVFSADRRAFHNRCITCQVRTSTIWRQSSKLNSQLDKFVWAPDLDDQVRGCGNQMTGDGVHKHEGFNFCTQCHNKHFGRQVSFTKIFIAAFLFSIHFQMYGVPPGAETIEEQALREVRIFQLNLAQKLLRFFNVAFLSLMVRSMDQWLQYFIFTLWNIEGERESWEGKKDQGDWGSSCQGINWYSFRKRTRTEYY